MNYNNASHCYNEFNLQVTRQQSRINALNQELEFRSKQLNDLQRQIEDNAVAAKRDTRKADRRKHAIAEQFGSCS